MCIEHYGKRKQERKSEKEEKRKTEAVNRKIIKTERHTNTQ